MRRKNALLRRVLPGIISAAMVFGSVPVTAFAALEEGAEAGLGTELKTELGTGLKTESGTRLETELETEPETELGARSETELETGPQEYARNAVSKALERTASDSDAVLESDSDAVLASDSNAFVLMNIPYSDFYENELRNDVKVDGISSATKTKPRTGALAGGSYHKEADGSEISGIIFPVLVGDDVDLSAYTEVTDEDSIEITVTNRGQTSVTTYKGKEALFENDDYAYYVLSEKPEFYKEMTVEDGEISFGKTVGTVETVSNASAEIMAESSYGDYQISVNGLPDVEKVYAVILSTDDNDYGLRHLENIWRVSNLAWCTGFTTNVHGCPTSSDHYESMMGQTIRKITYYTDKGIYEFDTELYVPEKFDSHISVEDAEDVKGETMVNLDLPSDFEAVYYLDGDMTEVSDGILSLAGLKIGAHTLTVKDFTGKYADIKAEFVVKTAKMPAAYGTDEKALVAADGADDEELANYIGNITSVRVNGEAYAASGRGAVVIINEDGSLKTDAEPIKADGAYEITVVSTGYADLTFIYSTEAEEAVYVLMNIPYEEFYEAEVNNDIPVDGFSSATKSKPRTGTLAGGSYHVSSDGSSIDGITFPVKVGEGVDLSDHKQVTDADSVEITVTNRGQTSTTVYTGKDALFENETYAYYILSEVPEFYKEAAADADGKLTFGKTVGEVKAIDGSVQLSTESGYGDYQLSVNADELADVTAYAVVLETAEGSSYGLRHLENIWRVTNLAWSTGFTKAVHNCPTSSAHYESMMGQTIKGITYYTSSGIYSIAADVYVPVKFDGSVSVKDASINAGKTSVTITGLPFDYDAEYRAEGLDMAVNGSELSFANASKGEYKLVVSDKNGKYADMSADFILYTENMPVRYNGNSKNPALTAKADTAAAELADYLANITAVSVDGVSYPATGRGAVVIINADGTLKTDAEPLAGAGSHRIVVTSTGYQDLSFTYIPYSGASSGSGSDGDSDHSGSGSGSGSSSGSDETKGQWVSTVQESGQVIWTYRDGNNRNLYGGSWGYLHNPYAGVGQDGYGWFHFHSDGTLQTGWFTDTDGSVYYLNPSADGSQGMALTGWQFIDGSWYFFRNWTGAPYGSLLKGGRTPDGYIVNADGVWDGGAKAE